MFDLEKMVKNEAWRTHCVFAINRDVKPTRISLQLHTDKRTAYGYSRISRNKCTAAFVVVPVEKIETFLVGITEYEAKRG